MAGLFTFAGSGQHEYFAKTIEKLSHARITPRDTFHYDFSNTPKSVLSDSQTLCRPCSVLQLENVPVEYTASSEWGKPPGLKANVPGFEEDVKYHRKDTVPLLPTLAESADAGCGFCYLLRNATIQHFQRYQLGRLPDDTIELLRIRHFWNPGLTAFAVYSPDFVRPGHRADYLTFRVSANLNDGCASVLDICTKRIPDSIMSPAGIFTLKKWILGSKEEKAALKASFQPTRLLHVESRKKSGLIRLVETRGSLSMAYLALSYCWGKKDPSLKTTKSNYSHLQKSISYSAMPKAYQDTVRVARALGVKYIWIDALCIIQDDREDWERESRMMAEIFHNSLATLILLRSASCNEGFLERNPSIKINYHNQQWDIRGSFFLRHMPFSYAEAESSIRAAPSFSDRPISLELGKSLWQTRGWTFQEDMFSMRKLYFGQLMMYWDSLKPLDMMRTEDTIIDDKLDRAGRSAEISIIHSSEPWKGDYDYDGWYYPMLNYCQKNLTYETDRLPAVSSYAKLIASKSGDTYVAGLWKKNLHRGLLWKIGRRQRRTFRTLMRKLSTSSEYIAPSWSWASHNGILHFDLSDGIMQPECKILEAKTKDYGDVYGCWLAIEDEQYVAQCALDWRLTNEDGKQLSEASGDAIHKVIMLLIASSYTKNAGAFSRRPQEWEINEEDPPVEVMHGLLLYPTGKAGGEYWRVGLFHSLADEKGGRSYFDRCDEREFRII
ncbi:heterokaryon incompatibility domain-containing protein [Trichoderma austrokoningii]